MLQGYEGINLLKPTKVTGAGVTGSIVDLQGYVTEKNIKALFSGGAGSAAGTYGGYLQVGDSSTMADAVTALTFDTGGSTGGMQEKHFTTTKRYVRFVGTVQTSKDMYLSCVLVAQARVRP